MKRPAIVNLREIDVVVESVGMAKIVVAGDHTPETVFDHFGDSLEISIKPVHLETLNPEPRAAVNPRTPLAESGHLGRGVANVKFACEPPEAFNGGRLRGPVVDSEIDVETSRRGASCPGSSPGLPRPHLQFCRTDPRRSRRPIGTLYETPLICSGRFGRSSSGPYNLDSSASSASKTELIFEGSKC
jgi:hypothetical protein